jgi:hypothetical protein
MIRAFFATVLILIAGIASGAEMNNQQKNTLRAAILSEPALAANVLIRDDTAIANYCNAIASPVQKVWKTTYTGLELFEAVNISDYIGRSVAERQAFDLMESVGVMDPSRAKVRSAIADIFSGATNSGSRSVILNDMTRNATWAEQKLGGTEVGTSGVTAWRLNWDGILTASEISALLNQ